MHKPTIIFIGTLVLFAAGTSVIGYSIASESYNASKSIQAAFTLIDKSNIPWYCASTKGPVKGQSVDSRVGYFPSGYTPPNAGYQPPVKSGYTPPGYQNPKPGYQEASPTSRAYDGSSLPAQLPPRAFSAEWQKSLPCPKGSKINEAFVVNKCSLTLQKKLDGNPLPAESKEQYHTCQKILATGVWNAKISQKICSAFYLYENNCAISQKTKKACQPLSKYLAGVGVTKKDIPKTQSDSIYLCKDVFPKP